MIQRLNDAFESAWSFEIVSHEIHQDEVIVIGKLIAEDVVKTQFGSSRITRALAILKKYAKTIFKDVIIGVNLLWLE